MTVPTVARRAARGSSGCGTFVATCDLAGHDTTARAWSPDRLVTTHLAATRDDLGPVDGLDDGERVRRVADGC